MKQVPIQTATVQKALIVIPTYNELENLPKLLELVWETVPWIQVLVVDDGSPDGTGGWVEQKRQVEPRLHLLRRAGKMGLGSAYVAGFRYAIENEFDVVFEMDADFSHDPKYLPDFLREIENADIVLGSRYLNGVNVVNWPMSRLLLSYCANIYARFITKLPIHDATGGFKCFRISALKALNLNRIGSDGYCFQIEISYKLWRKGFRLKEIPIVFVDRAMGVSKMSGTIIYEALFLLIKLRLGLG